MFLFAALDLADVGSVKSAYVSKFLLRPLLGRTKHLNTVAQKYQ